MQGVIKDRNKFTSNKEYFEYINDILLEILDGKIIYDIIPLANAINQLDYFNYLYTSFVWDYTLDQFLLLISKINNKNYTYKLILSYLTPKAEGVGLSDETHKEEIDEVKSIIIKLNNLGYSIDTLFITYIESDDLDREVEFVIDFVLRYTPGLLHFKFLSDKLSKEQPHHIVTKLINEYILHQM